MPHVELPKEDKPKHSYNPSDEDRKVIEHLSKRVDALKAFRSLKLPNNVKNIEEIWDEAEREYQPHELIAEGRLSLVSDEETGLRSRFVKLGQEEDWQSNQASPDLYVKVNTALSILVDQNPEAVFLPAGKRYEKNTALAYGNWKNSWEVSGAKQQLKNFLFNMSKLGVGFMRTYPKKVTMDKRIRTEYYPDQPERDKYQKTSIVKFNNLCRESLNPWQVWTSENALPGDYSSMDDWYFEKNFSPDKFKQVFGDYPNHVHAVPGSVDEPGTNNQSEGQITVGFYENQVLDLYEVWLPASKILLYSSPLPNDDGMLSLTYAPWTLRSDRLIWGIGLWEIIRNDSVLYDRLMNMTMDQLVLAIYKMVFYQGAQILGENGQLIVRPGGMEQVANASQVTFLEVPGPGPESWKGLQFLQDRKDQMSGVTPQLFGQYASKTLGQDIQAKEAALERLKAPLDYLLDALQQEAYITLSWQKQILSTPEILEYTDPQLLAEALQEWGLSDEDVKIYLQEAQSPQKGTELVFGHEPEEDGTQRKFANVYREVPYMLESDDKGELIEAKENRFYRFGTDLPLKRLEWKGIVRIKPQSVLAPSKELMRRMKLDLFNLVYPAIQGMLATPQLIPILLPPIKQVVKVYEEDTTDWFNEEELDAMAEAAKQPSEPVIEPPRMSISVKFEELTPDVQAQMLQKYGIVTLPPEPSEQPLFVDSASLNQPPPGSGMPSEQPRGGFAPIVPRGSLVGGKQGSMGAMQKQGFKIE